MMYYQLKNKLWCNVPNANSKWFEVQKQKDIINKFEITRPDYLFFGYDKEYNRKELTDKEFIKLLKLTKLSHQIMIKKINKTIKELQ